MDDRKIDLLRKMASMRKASPLNVEQSATGQQTPREKKACFPVLFTLFSAVRKVAGFLICMFMMRSCT